MIVGKIHESKDAHYGYNAGTDKFEDLVAAGVIDPTKVTRTALQNAASIAGLMLTTEAMVPRFRRRRNRLGGRRRTRRRHGRHVLELRAWQHAASQQRQNRKPSQRCGGFFVGYSSEVGLSAFG